jgi:hypothetical protein
MSGCKTQQDAADDRELERIMKMTDAEILAEVSDDDIEKAKQALEAAKRRLGL